MKGLQIAVLYDPDDPVGAPEVEAFIEEIAEFMAEKAFYGTIRVVEYNEDGEFVKRGIVKERRKKKGPSLFDRPKRSPAGSPGEEEPTS